MIFLLQHASLRLKDGRCRWNYLDVGPIQRIHGRFIQPYAMPSASVVSKLQQNLEAM